MNYEQRNELERFKEEYSYECSRIKIIMANKRNVLKRSIISDEDDEVINQLNTDLYYLQSDLVDLRIEFLQNYRSTILANS